MRIFKTPFTPFNPCTLSSGVQRSGDARGDCWIGCPYQILGLSSGV